MLKRLILLPLLIITVYSSGQTDNSILYEISGNGLAKPSYLMGVINFLPASRFKVPNEIDNAMQNCEVFVTKSSLDNRTQKKFNEAIRIPNNGWINDYLTDDELNQLRLLLLLDMDVKESAYYDFYSRLQPIILVTATAALNLRDDIVYPERSLYETAKKHKLKLDDLGTVQEEIDAFSKFPIEDQVQALKFTVNHFYDHIADYKKMVDAYLIDQDLDAVRSGTLKATNESKPFRIAYYDARSLTWLPKIEKMIQDKPTFFALGAPFLMGDLSLIALLETKGYSVNRVPVSFD
ncbi:MAG TPA: TraB/GumN family protein [Fulvivirga sp.]|nr:TraB/GumN family protein [Fulvivirga sp.]